MLPMQFLCRFTKLMIVFREWLQEIHICNNRRFLLLQIWDLRRKGAVGGETAGSDETGRLPFRQRVKSSKRKLTAGGGGDNLLSQRTLPLG